MPADQVHEKVVKILMKDIFTDKLKPGTKLPSERDLSQALSADRTSLRVALKRMESMNLLDIKHGQGIYVKDYIKHAGIDFLRQLLLTQNGEQQNEWLVDEYFLDEIYDFWVAVFPEMIKIAAQRITPRDIETLVALITEELEDLDNLSRVIAYEEKQQDLIAAVGNNMMFLLLSNSARPLRRKIIEIFVRNVDRDTLKRFLEAKIMLIQWYAKEGTLKQAYAAADKYREVLLN
jgi:DNA-binding FadR family transcriptional regulator